MFSDDSNAHLRDGIRAHCAHRNLVEDLQIVHTVEEKSLEAVVGNADTQRWCVIMSFNKHHSGQTFPCRDHLFRVSKMYVHELITHTCPLPVVSWHST